VLDALLILAYNSTSGLLLLLDIINPRYLNSFTFLTAILLILSYSVQFTYMALVFLTLITKSLSIQNYTTQSVRFYSSPGEGARRTKSSANASKNIYSDAMV
jgi:hypothetical protein